MQTEPYELDPEIEDLLPVFVAARQNDIASLEHLCSTQNYPVIARIGHTIRGSGGSFGFPAISTLGNLLQQAARAENDAQIVVLVAHLRTHLTAVEDIVRTVRPRMDEGGTT